MQDLIDIHSRLMAVQDQLKEIKKQANLVKVQLVEGFSHKHEWRHLFKTGERKEAKNFDATAFKQAHPELHAKFISPKTSWARFFVKPEESSEKLGIVELNIEEIKYDPVKLHQKFLEIWAAEAELSWEEGFLEASLISACRENIEIEGVMVWEEKTRKTFDKKELLEPSPEFEAELTKTTPAKTTYSPA